MEGSGGGLPALLRSFCLAPLHLPLFIFVLGDSPSKSRPIVPLVAEGQVCGSGGGEKLVLYVVQKHCHHDVTVGWHGLACCKPNNYG